MKILKPGIEPQNRIFQGKCNSCRCEFEFAKREATHESTCRNEDYLKIACPTCKQTVWVQI